MTVLQLARRLSLTDIRLNANPRGLALSSAVPADLARPVALLKTGLAALTAGRRWYGCSSATGRSVVLDPNALIPEGITLLASEGHQRWDRLPATARINCPALFAAAVPARAKS